VNSNLILERRVNQFRKSNHISEVNVLNNDGRRYVYGLPVYNLRQKEATFSTNATRGNLSTGMVGYNNGSDNTALNKNGKDNYFSSEEIPAYAHSFLLTGILSPDYVDVTGNGISDDDIGNAVKFNYSKVCGIHNPFKWRAPYVNDSVTFNPGLRTDNRDDKGNYVYGEKELWYMNSIESKTMIATFVVENRNDQYAIDESGHKYADNTSKRLKEIDLYNKSDLLKNPTTAKPVKVVHFEYDYELCLGVNRPMTDSGKLTLKKIWFTYNGNDKGKQNPYIFNYHANNPNYRINSYDRWGNFKDPSQNSGYTATNQITNSDYPYAVQDSALAAYNAAAWALDSVYLPSGGSIKVTYESDDYAYVQHKRAMQMFKLLGLSADSLYSHSNNQLYGNADGDHLYAFVSVPTAVANKTEVLQKYLTEINKLYFKLFVRMPDDMYGTGSEYVPCYATLDTTLQGHGRVSNNVIWIKMKGISLAGDGPGSYSPLAKAAIQFLRLNLPSKAYPGSEVGDNIDLADAVKSIFTLADNIKTAFSSFDATARSRNWAYLIDTSRTLVRLDNPVYKKYGGGHRVKRIKIYDNWDKMTGQRKAIYGQEYTYTAQQEINGVQSTISSGVASYEPGIGGEENPFRQPVEYIESVSVLGPTAMGYTEEPLGESLFPSPSVGYSNVRVRTINYKNIKSANGYDETRFYTAYDFPTLTDRTTFGDDTKKRYNPTLSNLLRINARYYLTMSQGFKVELNDMHGKLRSQASYPETDPSNPITYTENIYRIADANADKKVLANTVLAMKQDGSIDTAALIGKDVELMMDMREQKSVTNGANLSVNSDMFEMPFIPPLFLIPDLINLAQREENRFRSTATMKVIQRYGILDSVIHIDKGSKVTTKDLMYDSETGDVLLTRTQNEFNDPVYTFNYPSYWAYDGMGLAYKNIDLTIDHLFFRNGKIYKGLSVADSSIFSSGDEILVSGKQKTGAGGSCDTSFATFPMFNKIWAMDSSLVSKGRKSFYFIDAAGNPYQASDVTIKVIRSGRRNMSSSVGSATMLSNPLSQDPATHLYSFALNTSNKIVSAASGEFKQFWKVEDRKGQKTAISCTDSLPGGCDTCNYNCLKNFFDYLVSSKRLFTSANANVTVAQIVQSANSAGYSINISSCQILSKNSSKPFYALTSNEVDTLYRAAIGTCTVEWKSLTGKPVSFYTLNRKVGTSGNIYYDTHNGTGSPTYQIVQTLTNGDVQPAYSDVLPQDKVVIACGNIKRPWASFSSADTASVMVFDKTGANLWSKNLGIPYSRSAMVKTLSDSGFILLGSKLEQSSPVVHSIFIIRFDKTYNVTWAKNYSFNISGTPNSHDDLVPADFLPLSDGSFIVSGVKPPLANGKGFIFKINSSGSLIWAHEYNRPANSSNQIGPMIQVGDTLVTAGNGFDNGTRLIYDVFLSKISLANGTVLKSSTFHVGDTTDYDWPIHLYKASDNSGYYLSYFTSNTYSPIATDTTLIYGAVKIDNNINPINGYYFNYSGVDKHLTNALVSRDGNLVIAMKDATSNSNGSWLHKINFEGDTVLWTKHYQNADTAGQLYSISELSDASLFASGEKLKVDGKGSVFVMHTDASGNIPDGTCNLVDSGRILMLDAAPILLCTNFSDHFCGTWDTLSMEGPGLVATQSLSLSNISASPAYTCGYYNDTTTIAMLHVTTCHFCDTVNSNSCRSLVTDTLFNPYVAGVLGNWRGYKNYTYFGQRAESDPTAATNIRANGAFNDFTPFWAFANNGLQPQYDTSRWVWNSQITKFNKKGLEIENMDPLGRYNSGLYGYNFNLPIAVVQNGHYAESVFEGFEDYGFNTQGCDTVCPPARHFDFTPYMAKLSTTQRHSGKYSLQLGAHEDAGLTFNLSTAGKDSAQAKIKIGYTYDACTMANGLASLKTTDSVLLPAFSPFSGKQMLLGAWVKESQACNCTAYTHNQILLTYNGSSTSPVTLIPTGNIIEGWQRYEAVFTVPTDASSLTVDLRSTDTATVYFDDIRIHPFNANMKSFVYNQVNLRLMAELDENNYATFYEYDDDGTLIRVKKETEKGIMTIKETRSALLKQ